MGNSSINEIVYSSPSNQAVLHKTFTIFALGAGLVLCFSPLNSFNFMYTVPFNWSSPWPGTIGYLVVAVLIWWERKNLKEYHVDGAALAIFILARPVETLYLALIRDHDTGMAFPSVFSLVGCGISLTLALALWRGGYLPLKLSWQPMYWIISAIFSGIAVSIGLGWLYSFVMLPQNIFFLPGIDRIAKQTLAVFIYLLGNQVIIEETLLRGFLWGVLRQAGWKNMLIWLFQAVFGMICGISLISSEPLSFWIIIPLATLIPAAFTWRSRSVAASMSMRAVLAGLIYWSAYFFAASRF